MAPKPSSPFSRSVTKASALASARLRMLAGKRCWVRCSSLSSRAKMPFQGCAAWAPPGQRFTCSGGVRNSPRSETPIGASGGGRRAITTVSGTSTVRAQ
jgi:hypothetical protein